MKVNFNSWDCDTTDIQITSPYLKFHNFIKSDNEQRVFVIYELITKEEEDFNAHTN